MSATRLWSPVTRPAPFWLKPLPRNACSPVADGAALGTCVRLPTAATAAGRWLPSRGRCPHRSRPRRLGLCGDRSPALAWAAHGLCPVPWKAAPWTCEAPHGAEHVPVHQLWVWVFPSPRSHPQLVYDEPGIRRIVQNFVRSSPRGARVPRDLEIALQPHLQADPRAYMPDTS